jgi:branched-chain amino acid transport system permease protein
VQGGFAVGNIENLGGAYLVGTELKLTLALVIIVAVLTVKPTGLMGRRVYSRV